VSAADPPGTDAVATCANRGGSRGGETKTPGSGGLSAGYRQRIPQKNRIHTGELRGGGDSGNMRSASSRNLSRQVGDHGKFWADEGQAALASVRPRQGRGSVWGDGPRAIGQGAVVLVDVITRSGDTGVSQFNGGSFLVRKMSNVYLKICGTGVRRSRMPCGIH